MRDYDRITALARRVISTSTSAARLGGTGVRRRFGGGCVSVDFSIAEGTLLKIRSCEMDSDRGRECGKRVYARA